LQYASTGGKQLSDAEVTGVPLYAFEAEVYDVLTAQGISLVPQMGASRFRIDLVAQHPKNLGRFVLAIECDGASYHASPTARDRDRLRQSQLENLGWRFHRIWSTDWFMRKDEEVRRAVEAFQKAVEHADRQDSEGTKMEGPPSVSATPRSSSDLHSVPVKGSGRRRPRPQIPRKDSIDDYTPWELMELVRWINSDGELSGEVGLGSTGTYGRVRNRVFGGGRTGQLQGTDPPHATSHLAHFPKSRASSTGRCNTS
jgi:very-short-patch-repair endonuclease